MDDYLFFIFGIWLLSSLREVLGLAYFWQLKEYRLDRMRDFLGTGKGSRLLYSFTNIFRPVLLVILLFYFDEFALSGAVALGLFTVLMLVYSFKAKKLYRPKMTFRVMVVIFSVYALEISAFVFFKHYLYVLLFLEILRPLIVSIVVLLLGIPFKLAKKFVIKNARKKIRSLKGLKVIGITGSYGKTSTKEFLYDILSGNFNVVRTPKNINTDVGVARSVLNDLKDDTEIFIAEMAAYKRKEIDDICKIVHPSIGILTGINEQHLSLFGSIENTIRAKAELLASLPKNGVAIVNWDNVNCHKALKFNNADRVVKYCLDGRCDIKATCLEQDGKTLTFNVHIGDDSQHFEVGVLGKHYVQNLLAAIYCAYYLGLSLKEIAQYAKSCRVVEQSLELFAGKGGIRILDDSYNSNPHGFLAALHTARDLKPKRVLLVTMGMLELGKKSDTLHHEIAKEIKKFCDKVFVTSYDAYRIFGKHIDNIFFTEDYRELIKALDDEILSGDLVLFENRIQKVVLDHFKK